MVTKRGKRSIEDYLLCMGSNFIKHKDDLNQQKLSVEKGIRALLVLKIPTRIDLSAEES